jgi:hypothetical protein
MSYLSGIWLAVLGIMAAPNLIIAKKPEAKETLDKLVPYQGWFGAVSAVYGVIDIIRFLGRLDWFEYIPIGMITFIVGAVVTLALGLLLGIGVIKSFVSSAEAKAKMDAMIAKLAPKQGTLGLVGIIVGLWIIIYRLAGLTL